MTNKNMEPLSAFDLERLRAYAQTLPQYQHDFSAFVILRLLATLDAKEGEIERLSSKEPHLACDREVVRLTNHYQQREHEYLAAIQKEVVQARGLNETIMGQQSELQDLCEENARLERERITAVSALEWEKATHAAFVAVHHATVEKITGERDEAWNSASYRQKVIAHRDQTIDSLRADLAKAREERDECERLRAKLEVQFNQYGEEMEAQLAKQSRALAATAKKFREYEQIHLAKISPGIIMYSGEYDTDRARLKAKTNAEMAEMCERALRSEAKGAPPASTKTADQLLDDAEFFLRPRADVKLTESESHYRQLWREELGLYRAGQVDREAGVAGAVVHVPGPVRDEECSVGIPEADTVGTREGRVWQPAPEIELESPNFIGASGLCGNLTPCHTPGHAEPKCQQRVLHANLSTGVSHGSEICGAEGDPCEFHARPVPPAPVPTEPVAAVVELFGLARSVSAAPTEPHEFRWCQRCEGSGSVLYEGDTLDSADRRTCRNCKGSGRSTHKESQK